MVGKLSFNLWDGAGADAAAFRVLVQNDEIWEMQRTDGASKDDTVGRKYPGSWMAVWHDIASPIGFAIYIPIQKGIYEQHVGFMERWRGDFAVIALKKATERMFIETDAGQIIAQCPDYNLAVRMMAKQCGARELFYVEKFATRDGIPYGATICGKSLDEWVWDNHHYFTDGPLTHFPDSDEWEKTRKNMTTLTLEMARYGQALKAQFIFNRWAILAGYDQMKVLWHLQDSVILEVADHRVWIINGEITKTSKL